jgi:hypothetical protein
VLGDVHFPPAYAYLFVGESSVMIRHLGAGPELLVCGTSVESAELRDGDLVALGPFELRVRIDLPLHRVSFPPLPSRELHVDRS